MLWAIAMMKDEEDIADHVLYHFAQQGVDGILVADNLSNDSTRNKLLEAKSNIQARYPNIQIEIIDDDVVAYTQDAKMTNLAKMAGNYGATWIIPFDADELWYTCDGHPTLADAVQEAKQRGRRSIRAFYWDYKITELDEPGIPFVSMVYRKPEFINSKISFLYDPSISISNGNHFYYYNGDARIRDENPLTDSILIRHYGVRSREHFINKYANAYNACKALPSNSDLYNGAAWSIYFANYEQGGREGLGRAYDESWFGTEGLVYDPAPFVPWNKND